MNNFNKFTDCLLQLTTIYNEQTNKIFNLVQTREVLENKIDGLRKIANNLEDEAVDMSETLYNFLANKNGCVVCDTNTTAGLKLNGKVICEDCLTSIKKILFEREGVPLNEKEESGHTCQGRCTYPH